MFPKKNRKQNIWSELYALNKILPKPAKELLETAIEYEDKARQWGKDLVGVYQSDRVTPYIHTMMNHELHNEHVLVPADKASNNIIIVCKKYYSEVIRNELAGKSGKASTYVHCRDSVDQIVQKHLTYKHSTKIKVAEDMKRLPGFYWMPKLHKNPYGHCFIAASASCTTKPLSKLLTHCLQLILKHYKEYCKGIERRTGVNCFWVINNSIEVSNTL